MAAQVISLGLRRPSKDQMKVRKARGTQCQNALKEKQGFFLFSRAPSTIKYCGWGRQRGQPPVHHCPVCRWFWRLAQVYRGPLCLLNIWKRQPVSSKAQPKKWTALLVALMSACWGIWRHSVVPSVSDDECSSDAKFFPQKARELQFCFYGVAILPPLHSMFK